MNKLQGANILITGGLGMIGSTIADKASEQGANVTIADAKLPLYGANAFNIEPFKHRIKVIQADLRDYGRMTSLVKTADIIFNLAAQVSYVDSNVDPFVDLDINCKGHLTVLEACRKVNPNVKVIFSSSRFVYGTIVANPVDESHPFNCLSIYGIHKLAGERYYQFYHKAYGIRHTIFRIANPYGPRQQMRHSKYGIVNWFIRLALEGKPLTIYGDGKQVRDYIFVEDLADAMIMAACDNKTDGEVYNIGSGTGTGFGDMAEIIADVIPDTKIEHVEWPQDRYFVETGDYVTDISKICSALGWKPRTSLREGIEKTIDYYRRYGAYYWSFRAENDRGSADRSEGYRKEHAEAAGFIRTATRR